MTIIVNYYLFTGYHKTVITLTDIGFSLKGLCSWNNNYEEIVLIVGGTIFL